MIKIKYNNCSKMVDCEFRRISNHIVSLIGGQKNKSGFCTYRMDGQTQLGDFSSYNTIYRVLDDCVQYSDDESTYTELEIIEIPEPTPEEIAEQERLASIAKLKAELATYDYIGIKIAMGVATIDEYAEKISYTEELRKQIRKLEEGVE